MDQLILKRANASRPSGHWSEDDYDVLSHGKVVGRIMKVARPKEPWLWTLDWDHRPWWGFEATREAAMAALTKSWQRQ